MNKDFMRAIDELEKEKGIPKEVVIEAIETALLSGYKKNYGKSGSVKVEIDPETGDYNIYSEKTVVGEIEDEGMEIDLQRAKELDKKFEIGDVVKVQVKPKEDFGRIAAQTSRQVILQKIREAERENIYEEFHGRESEIVTGTIQRISKNNIFVNLGKIEGILTESEQIPGEIYRQGDRIKSVILEVKNTSKGANITLSRTHPSFVKRLFELEVPEIYDGVIDIISISREAGSRTKISVVSNDANVDPVGSCVGNKGTRVKSVVDEINNEKIDIIVYDKDPAKYISNSLSPATPTKVEVNEKSKSALVIVPDYQLSLAIGKEGQNARLAAKLTGWKIDIKSETQYASIKR
ncbi:MAG: transcription termination/antitermination protein NusA [Tissierellales bacterium]|nr:transcription termination/antitermination protein NusA [Tissierellales bacterium]MBN2827957.1 transcription termination/antitermination protein NusA [Tissierellales bacterium]